MGGEYIDVYNCWNSSTKHLDLCVQVIYVHTNHFHKRLNGNTHERIPWKIKPVTSFSKKLSTNMARKKKKDLEGEPLD